ncbi:MAG: hypothetical protein N2690_12845, partial [Rhodocyclaceae bacterium]|nr:hypothetical protein [Rhodocyclaceae bacterium]
LAEIKNVINEKEDDIRAYHIPDHCKIWSLGLASLPDGVEVDADTAVALLLRASMEEEET